MTCRFLPPPDKWHVYLQAQASQSAPSIPAGEARPLPNNIQHPSSVGVLIWRTRCEASGFQWSRAPTLVMENMNNASLLTWMIYSPPKLLRVTSGLQGIDAHTCTHGRDTFAWRSHTSHQITSHSSKRLYTVISRRLCSDTALSCSNGLLGVCPTTKCHLWEHGSEAPLFPTAAPWPRLLFRAERLCLLRVHGVIWRFW